MAVPQAARRISALPESTYIEEIQAGTTVPDQTYTYADAWAIGIDSLCRSNSTTLPGPDEGTTYIPMSRIAMRDTNGLIPANMLPSYVDDMMFGTLDITASRATFTEHMPSGGTQHVYVSPTTPGYPLPPQNVIFCDTTSNIQYRFTGETSTDEGVNHFGFTEVPGSRAINAGYGIEITNANDANMTVSAKKADFFTSYDPSTAVPVTSSYDNIPATSTYENSVIDAVIASNRLTKLTHITPNARYALNLQLACTPNALSPNIIDVTVKCANAPIMVQQMSMAGPNTTSASSPSITRLDYFCEFKTGATELTVQIKADEDITVTTTRFTLFELL